MNNSNSQEEHQKIFVEQASTAMAMVDNNMCYIAASSSWIKDYGLEGIDIIGRSHYEIFPEIGDDWKAMHQRCLNGATDICEETSFERKDGSIQWIYWDVRPWFVSGDKIGGILMHTGDVTRRKEKELKKARIDEILEKTNEIARIGTWELNLLTKEAYWSKIACEIHEVPEDFVPDFNSSISFVKEGESRKKLRDAIENAKADGTHYNLEVEIITAKGNVCWTRIVGRAEYLEGKQTRLFGIIQDITKTKLAEQQLSKAHSELEAIFNSECLVVYTTDKNGIINRFNHGAEVLLGYSADEIVGLKQPGIFLVEEEMVKFKSDMAKIYDKDSVTFNHYVDLPEQDLNDTREWIYRRKDGSKISVLCTVSAIKNSMNKNEGFVVTSQDISEIKKVENELLKKNQLLNYAEEITSMGNWQWNTVADKVKWSKNLYKVFELDETNIDLKFDTYFSFVHPEDKEVVTQYFNKIAKDKKLNNFTHRIITTSGKLKTIQLIGEVLTNEEDEIVEMIGTCQDVTESKMAEHQLQKALSELQAIFNSDSILIISTDKNGIINRFNQGAESLLGYSAAEMVGIEKPRKYANEDEIKKFRSDIAALNDEDPNTYDHYLDLSKQDLNDTREWTYYKKDGSPVYVLSTITTIKNGENDNEGFVSISKDITEIKAVENELLKKNQLLNFAEQISMMSNWKWNTVLDKVEWSQNFYKILELDEAIIELNFNSYFRFVHPEDIEIVNRHFEKVEKDKKWESLTHRIITTSGKLKTILILGEVFTNEKDEIVEMIGTCQDVTEIKMAEKKFRGLLESAPDAMVIVNEAGAIQLINKQSERLFGYTLEELFNKSVEVLIPTRFISEHSMHSKGFFNNPKTREMGEGKELYGVNKCGNEIPIQISLSPLYTEEGLLVSAAIRDITKQKLAEQRIIEAKESLEVIAQKLSKQNKQLADFTHITSHNLRAPVANLNSLLEIYDCSESEALRSEIFNKFRTVIQHLTLTLNTLVDSLKTKIGDSNENLEEIELKDVLENTTEILSGAILQSGAIIKSDFSQVSDIYYNRVYLESIFLNLIGNSIKYKSEERVPEIQITSKIINKKKILEFKDNGLGIDLKKHGHKLFGLNKVFHRHPDAKGVGLFLTKSQIEAMGGVISASSTVGVGTTFTINFN
ncbi:PAS domain S-box protein [Zobellia roscoffensis]|uniref:PAS domain-containing sensor histidine kinase n=1 Tax=Zobellia roscoffensis TaxID=2779508 RepID=UPI00188A1834|nr:PAS domain S-box protein [Zobellia roscoffensis]